MIGENARLPNDERSLIFVIRFRFFHSFHSVLLHQLYRRGRTVAIRPRSRNGELQSLEQSGRVLSDDAGRAARLENRRIASVY